MIIMNVKADNFYCFDNFEVDFSYPKIIPSNMVEYEYLDEYKNFRFKKVNIIMGENASGKTNFGKFLMQIFNFIVDHNHTELYNSINNKNREASFAIDILMRDNSSDDVKYDLYRLSCTLNHIDKSKYDDDIKKNLSEAIKKLILEKVTLKSADSYERATERYKTVKSYEKEKNNSTDIRELLDLVSGFGWYFMFPGDNHLKTSRIKNNKDLLILSKILKTFDSSIENVVKVDNSKDGYQILFKNRDSILMQDGKFVNEELLSSGTIEAVGVCDVLLSMITSKNRTFYIDEKFSHAHVEIERAILNLMIELIGKESQLFFTTHNLDILNMNLPNHAFIFFHKDENNETRVVNANDFVKKNNRNLMYQFKNNVFSSIPDIEEIENILDLLQNGESNEK